MDILKPSSLILMMLVIVFHTSGSHAQDNSGLFHDYQFSSGRVSAAWEKYNATLQQDFAKHDAVWPPASIYLRAFKSQNELELWAANDIDGEYKKIKTYMICAMSGKLGPKRKQGDKQVPEGFYFIDDFNAHSEYHLSLLLNYPNYADILHGNSKLGGDIYIHGGCLTIGCLPMTDEGVSELYTVCLAAKLNGQDYIPVHIFPTHMSNKGIGYLINEFRGEVEKQQFWAGLKQGYDYFEKNRKLQPVMYTQTGSYVNY